MTADVNEDDRSEEERESLEEKSFSLLDTIAYRYTAFPPCVSAAGEVCKDASHSR